VDFSDTLLELWARHQAGARTFLSAATHEFAGSRICPRILGVAYCCGQQCPRSGLLALSRCARHDIAGSFQATTEPRSIIKVHRLWH